MNAIEFQTVIKNSFVQIPNYEEFENRQVRIIILDETVEENTKTSTSNFIAKYGQSPKEVDEKINFLSRDEGNVLVV